MKYRITEVIDSRGTSIFYPERKVFGLWWWKWGEESYGPDTSFVSFNTIKEAREYLAYNRRAKVFTHGVDGSDE